MKRLLTLLLVIISVNVFGQLLPAPSGTLTPLSTNQAYVRLSDSTYYFYNGTNYLWNYFLNKQQADKLYQPLGSPVATPFSLSTGYGLSGSSFNGSAARTFTADTTSATGLVSKQRLSTNLTGYVPKTTTLTINGSTRDLSTNRIWNVGTVLSVGVTAGTGISISGSPITSSGNITVTNTAPDQTVVLNEGTGISTSGTYPNFTITNTLPAVVGIQDSLTKKANRTFDNVASGAIANVKLANSTISGVALGSNLNALTLGNGLTGTSYNGSGSVTATADTTVVQTVSNFFPKGDTRYQRLSVAPTSISATSPIFYNSGTGVISSQAASASLEGYVTTGSQTFAGLKTFNNNIEVGATGTAGKISFRRSSDGAIASTIEQVNDNKLTLTSAGGTRLFDISADTVMISALTNGLVKSTSGKLSNAVAGTDYLTPTGSGSGLSGVVLTTTNQSIAGNKTFDGVILSNTSVGTVIQAALSSTNFLGGTFQNTGGQTRWGTASSTGNSIFSGDGAYASVFGAVSNTPLEFYTNNTKRLTIANSGDISATGSISSTPQGTLYGTATGSITSAQLATSLTDETGTGSAVFSASPTLTTPNIGVATFTTLTGGTASTITFANTGAGSITDAISIRNGGTTAGSGNRINFITGAATQSARIASSLTSSTDANLVFSTMTGGTIGEAGRFLGDKTLQLTGALTGTSATFSSTLTSIAFIKTVSGEWGIFNNTASGASSASYYQNYGTDSGSGVIRWYVGQNAFRTDGSFAIQNVAGTGLYLTSGSTSWTSTSDERSKDIIRPITNALNDINSWRTVIGKYKNDETGKERIFLIAQDILVTTPQVVDVSDEGNLGLRYLEIIPVLVKGIQELKAEIEILKQK